MVFYVVGGKDDRDEGRDVTVRRWTATMPRGIDAHWMESVYLNVVMHTVYTLTVAICSKSALERHRKGQAAPAVPISKVSRKRTSKGASPRSSARSAT